jgi:hypothetical protein
MRTINKQLQIGVPNRDVNLVNRYARGLQSYQPQLMNEDFDLDYYNDTQEIDAVLDGVSPYRDVNLGSNWFAMDGDRDLGEEMYEASEDYSNFAYPLCLKDECRICKSKCKNDEGKRWLKGGKACYQQCRAQKAQSLEDSLNAMTMPQASVRDADIAPPPPAVDQNNEGGMGTGAKIGLVVGGLAVVGLIGFMLMRKK